MPLTSDVQHLTKKISKKTKHSLPTPKKSHTYNTMATSKSLLVVVLEINKSLFVNKSNSPKSLNSFANAIVAFLKSHHLLNRDNRSMTIACGNNEAEFLAQENYDSTTYATFSSSLASRIEKFGASGGGGLGSAMSMALCHIQKYVFLFS